MQAHFLGAEAWDRIAPTWRAWHAADSSAALYESPEYARYKMSELPQNFVGGILELAEGDASVAYVPFRMQRSLAGIPTRDIQTLGLGAHAPNHSAPSSAVVAEALRALRPYRCRVETLEPEHSPVGRLRGYEALSGKDGVIPLASTWESFVETQSSRMRKHLRHALRVMEKKEWRIEDLSHQAEPAIEQANVLHDAYLNHKFPVYRGQYRAAQRDASFASCFGEAARAYALMRGDSVASILYGVEHRESFYLFRQGNDPAWFDEFPDGASLTLRAALMRRLIEDGVASVNVVGGTEGLWAAQPDGRRLAVYATRAPHARVCRAVAGAIARNHRTPWVNAARRVVSRISPRLASHAA